MGSSSWCPHHCRRALTPRGRRPEKSPANVMWGNLRSRPAIKTSSTFAQQRARPNVSTPQGALCHDSHYNTTLAWSRLGPDRSRQSRQLSHALLRMATIGPGIDTVARDKVAGRHYRAKPQGRGGPHADQSGQITYPRVTLPAYHAMHVGG